MGQKSFAARMLALCAVLVLVAVACGDSAEPSDSTVPTQ